MHLIIRYKETRGVGSEINDAVFHGDLATLGRGTDQTIQIPDRRIPLKHSKISMSAGKLTISSVGENRLSVNDKTTKRETLVVKDVVTIAGHEITVFPGEKGADFVLEVKIEAESVEKLRDRYTTRLREIGLPARSVSWVLFVSILAIGLLIPATGFFLGNDQLQALRESPLPDDSLWETGKLHQTHSFMGDDCSYCHTEAFTQTKDEDCLYCHLSVTHHFDTKIFGRDYRVGDSCGDCHKEHSTTDSITRSDQEVCSGCHRDLESVGYISDRLQPASDFLEDHPDFLYTFNRMGEDHQWTTERLEIWADDAFETSNLKFPHDVHLAEEGVTGVDGPIIMECGDCHQPEKGGLSMKTVTMEDHCAECHQLTFDPSTPDRVVPHGSPPDLMRTLREYYAYQFLTRDQPKPESMGTVKLEVPKARDVRRPGRKARTESIADLIVETQIDKSAPLTQQAAEYIEARVDEAAANLFEKQTCTICHEITKNGTEDVPWQVLPVYLSNDWMPLAEFSHESHKNMQCEGCHDASYSADSSEVLMPDIGGCRSCHGGEHAESLLQSTCISCHEFHLEGQNPMGVLVEVSELERQAQAEAESMGEMAAPENSEDAPIDADVADDADETDVEAADMETKEADM